MTTKTAACAMAVALLAGTAAFATPALAQKAPLHHATMAPRHARLFLSTVAVYDAGLRRGRATSSNNAYLRGFRDGTSTAAYNPRRSVADSYVVNPVVADPGYSYSRDAAYAPGTGGYYSSYDGRRAAYYDNANGYASDRYDARPAPLAGLMDVVVAAPVAPIMTAEAQAAHMSYCTARYQSFDPASNTFLADDGNRYYCR
jgi:hypothetical protein